MEQSSQKEAASDELGSTKSESERFIDKSGISQKLSNTKSESARLEEKKYISEQKAVDREDALALTVNRVVQILVWTVLIGAVFVIGTILAHYTLPEELLWIKEERLRELKSFALSGVIGSLVTLAFNKLRI